MSLEQPEREIARTVEDNETPFLLTFEKSCYLMAITWQYVLNISGVLGLNKLAYWQSGYQLEGCLECSVNVEVFLSKKTETLPQLWLPREKVESPANPRETVVVKSVHKIFVKSNSGE